VLPPLFYVPDAVLEDNLICLSEDEAHHAARVLRMKPGEQVVVVDGAGNAYRSEIVTLTARGGEVRVHAEVRDLGEPSVRLTLAMGLSTGFKFDEIIQRGTELGVTRFVPLVTEKARLSLEDPKRVKIKLTRWTKVAVAAMKQCRRSCLPQITAPVELNDFLGRFDRADTGLIFHPSPKASLMGDDLLSGAPKRVTLLVGPESGFSDKEVEAAEGAGFRPVSLGRRVLRTETAGPIAVALVMATLGEFR
jgi:16S rRNA (uracil1498-N3)-methyltransferase